MSKPAARPKRFSELIATVLLALSIVATALVATLATAGDRPGGGKQVTRGYRGLIAGKMQLGRFATLTVKKVVAASDKKSKKSKGTVTLRNGRVPKASAATIGKWFRAVKAGKIERKNISIQLQDNRNKTLRRWNLMGCFPKSWKVNGFDGKGNDVVTEEVVFVVEDMQIASRRVPTMGPRVARVSIDF